MEVTVTQGSHAITTQPVRQAGVYRFVLPQGKHAVSLDQPNVRVPPGHFVIGHAFAVTVKAGQTTNLSVGGNCK